MADEAKSTFLVSVDREPIVIALQGRVSYMNCAPLRKLMDKLIEDRNAQFVIDLGECTGIDSTVLGILAHVAMEVRKKQPPGYVQLCRLNERNWELVKNLGLNHLMDCRSELHDAIAADKAQALEAGDSASKQTILEAHQKLMQVDKGNIDKFQDVVSYLKKQVEQE